MPPGFFSALADLLHIPPLPDTPRHRDTMHRCMKERNEELAKPAGQRDAEKLLQLTKRVLRMRIDSGLARAWRYRREADLATRDQYLGCCADCKRARLRIVASLRAEAAWTDEWVLISSLRLEALEQGHPKPPLVLPYLDVQPYLGEGVPAELPASSIDRCAACQKALEQQLYRERHILAQVDYDP